MSQEKPVLDILRGAAGALSDLVEDSQVLAEREASQLPASVRGDKSPDPGAKRKRESPKKEEKPPTEYSYSQEEGEDEIEEEQEADYDRSPSVEEPPEPKQSRPSTKPKVSPDVDPHYLSKALGLKPGPTAPRKSQDSKGKEEVRGSSASGVDRRREHPHQDGEVRIKEGPGGSGSQRPRTPEREPIKRRKPQRPRGKRKRGSGGRAKRERAENFRTWVAHRREQKKKEEEWHPRRR